MPRRLRSVAVPAALAALLLGAAPARAADEATAVQHDPGRTGFASGGSLDRPPLTERWSRDLGTALSAPLIADGRAFVSFRSSGTTGSTVAALDLQSGGTLWWRAFPGTAELAYEEGRVFVVSTNGTIAAVGARTGETLWTRQFTSRYQPALPVARDGLLFAMADDYTDPLFALDTATGTTRWEYRVNADQQPSVDEGFVYFTQGCDTTALHRRTGKVAWRATNDCSTGSGGRSTTDGGRVTLLPAGGVYDVATGTLDDAMQPDQSWPATAGATQVALNGRTLQARNVVTGVGRWEFTGDGALHGSPIVVNHTVYAGSTKGSLFAVDLRTGAPLWSAQASTSPSVEAGKAGLAAGQGTLLVPTGGRLVAYGRSDLAARPGLDLAIATGPAGAVTSADATFTFAATGIGFSYRCRLDAGDAEPCTGAATYTGLADGPHVFEVETVDGEGEPVALASRSFSVDTKPPATTLASAPPAHANVTYATFTLKVEANVRYECRLDDAAWADCAFDSYERNRISLSALSEGAHTMRIRGVDPAGNEEEPVVHTWRIETDDPETTIVARPESRTRSRDAELTFTSDEPDVAFECTIDASTYSATWSTCTSPKNYANLADGTRTFRVRARDRAGNVDSTPASHTWTVDTTPPVTTLYGPTGTTRDPNPVLSPGADESAGYRCRLDGGAWTSCTSSWRLTGLADGTHTAEAVATDTAGNEDPTPASLTWTIDTRAPVTSIETSSVEGSSAIRVSFAADEPGATFLCQLDAGPWQACTSPVSYVGLAPGEHTFRVQATDPYGNRDVRGASWGFAIPAAPAEPGGGTAGGGSGLPTWPPARPPDSSGKRDAPPAQAAYTPRQIADALATIAGTSLLPVLRKDGSVLVPASLPSRGRLTLELRKGRTVLARGRRTVPARRTVLVRMRATRGGRRILRRLRRGTVTLRVELRTTSGRRVAARRSVRL